MNEKNLERLIVNGFTSQQKYIDKRFNEERTYFDQQLKELKIEMVTHNDIDQKLENNSLLIIKEMDRRSTEMNQRFNQILNELKNIRSTLDRVNIRNNEEIADLYKRVDILEQKVSKFKEVGI